MGNNDPRIRRMPGDLMPRSFSGRNIGGGGDDLVQHIADNSDLFISTFALEQGLSSTQYTITTSPQLIIDGKYPRSYILLNPSAAVGLTNSGTLLASAAYLAGASGNTQSAALGVASFLNLSLFLNITTSGGGTVTVNAQSQDPLSLNWATTQGDLFGAPSAVGTYYANLGSLGVDKSFAISYTVGGGGGVTFSIGYVLKNGLPGGGSGLANTIYLGGPQVTSVNGYPLLEGQSEKWFFRSNAQLWATSVASAVTLSVFALQ